MRCVGLEYDRLRHGGGQPLRELRFKRAYVFYLRVKTCCGGKCRNSRHSLRSRAALRLLTAAADKGRQTQPAADIQRADALNSMYLMSADADKICAEL